MLLSIWRISFITLLHYVNPERHVISKYETYLILESILNASIVKFDNSIIRLLNEIDNIHEIATENSLSSNIKKISEPDVGTSKPPVSNTSTNLQSASSKLNRTAKLKTTDKHINFSKKFTSTKDESLTGNTNLKNKDMSFHQSVNDELSTVKSVLAFQNASDSNDNSLSISLIPQISSSIKKDNTAYNISAVNKTDATNSSESLRRQLSLGLEKLLGKLEGNSGREEVFYEPYWHGGDRVFMRTGTKLRVKDKSENSLNDYRNCDRICSVFEDAWYGRICACRRDDWWIDLILKDFTSLCEMEKENCESPNKSWYPFHRGPCTYPKEPMKFLSTVDERYEASTILFYSRADFYEKEFSKNYPTKSPKTTTKGVKLT